MTIASLAITVTMVNTIMINKSIRIKFHIITRITTAKLIIKGATAKILSIMVNATIIISITGVEIITNMTDNTMNAVNNSIIIINRIASHIDNIIANITIASLVIIIIVVIAKVINIIIIFSMVMMLSMTAWRW